MLGFLGSPTGEKEIFYNKSWKFCTNLTVINKGAIPKIISSKGFPCTLLKERITNFFAELPGLA